MPLNSSKSLDSAKSAVVVGKKLKNPYSVENMKRAMDTILHEIKNFQQSGVSTRTARVLAKTEEIEIKATDLYVRFLPKDSLELDLIEQDTTLVLYEYPLDYEIELGGGHYHDPSLPENQITWQYTVVKPDYKFPEVEYEILSDLFIPENYPGYNKKEGGSKGETTHSKTNSLDMLETVALYLTDNLPEEEMEQIEEQKKADAVSRRVCVWFVCWDEPDPWNPSGYIEIEDTELGWQPIMGVKVTARRWFTTH